MIICCWGSDREGSRRAARAELMARRGSASLAPVFDLAGDILTLEELQEVVSARPLTGGGVIAFFDHFSTNSILVDFVIANLPTLQSSPSVFIFWEDEKSKMLVKAISAAGGETREFKVASDLKQQQAKAELTKLFAVADALGDRDRKRAWLLYHDARRDGLAAEEIFWKFVWKVKTLLLVETARSGSVPPLKPYPLSQARRQVKSYKVGELARLSSRLVRLYHDARRGLADFDFSLERLLLEL